MFKSYHLGINTNHTKGFVHKSNTKNHYLLMRFRTPFFYRANDIRGEGKPSDCILHRTNSDISHGPLSAKSSFINDWILFSADESEEEFLSTLPADTPIRLSDEKTFERLLTEIVNEKFIKDEHTKKLVSGNIYHLLVLFLRSANSAGTDELCYSFKEIRASVMASPERQWTLEELAKLYGYSTSRFSALYTEIFGISPINDILENRLNTAKRLLALKTYSVGQIAELCGFSSIHYFSKFFKSHTGKSPSEYRGK